MAQEPRSHEAPSAGLVGIVAGDGSAKPHATRKSCSNAGLHQQALAC